MCVCVMLYILCKFTYFSLWFDEDKVELYCVYEKNLHTYVWLLSLSLSLWNMKFAQLSFVPNLCAFLMEITFASLQKRIFIMSANNFLPNNFTSKWIWIFSSSLILEMFALNFLFYVIRTDFLLHIVFLPISMSPSSHTF